MKTDTQLELAIAELFDNRAEEMPLWLELRSTIEDFGPDVRIEVRERYAAFDRGGEEFVIVEPAAHRHLEVGLHNPGLPFDERFREAVGFGSRRITHRITLSDTATIDEELRARLHAAYLLAYEGEPS
jgi:predicted transport protein